MNESRSRLAVTALKWTLGLVVLAESLRLALAQEDHFFAAHPFLHHVRPVVAWSEVAAAVLFLTPYTTFVGGCFLLVIFVLAMVIHVLHGQIEVGGLLVYAMAAVVVLTQRKQKEME